MSQREKTIGVIFIVLFVFFVLSKLPKAVQKPLDAIIPQEGTQDKLSAFSGLSDEERFESENLIALIKLKLMETSSGEINDPFKKVNPNLEPKNTQFEFADLILTGIIMEEEVEPLVIINDQILKKGEFISDFEIKEIRENEVIVIRGVEKYTLKLFSEL